MCVRSQPTQQQQQYRKPTLQTRPCYAKANSSLITSTPKMRRDILPTTIMNNRVHPHQSQSPRQGKKHTHTRVTSRRVSMERRRKHFSIKINKTTRQSSRGSSQVFSRWYWARMEERVHGEISLEVVGSSTLDWRKLRCAVSPAGLRLKT